MLQLGLTTPDLPVRDTCPGDVRRGRPGGGHALPRFVTPGQVVRYEAQAVSGTDRMVDARGLSARGHEFIGILLTERHLTSSTFREAIKAMKDAERILSQALLATEAPQKPGRIDPTRTVRDCVA